MGGEEGLFFSFTSADELLIESFVGNGPVQCV